MGFYRAALTFELQDYIKLEYIQELEEKNAKYFYNEIQKFNEEIKDKEPKRKVVIYGESHIEVRFDVFSFNIQGPGSLNYPD